MAERTFSDGNWNAVEIAFWRKPKIFTAGKSPTQKCTRDPAQIVMTEIRIYHWTPAAHHVNGG
eukprot:2779169-Pyramimonas_sp.AAC.1